MSKKNIVVVVLLAVGFMSVYKIYKNNLKTYPWTSYKSEIAIKTNEEPKREEEVFFTRTANKPEVVSIKVYKGIRILELYGDDKLIGRFKIAIGGSPIGDKDMEGDRKTPEGTYYICTRNDKSKYTLFLGLSYPNIEDAQRGLEKGLIDDLTFRRIKTEIESGKMPPWKTPLGGEVGIHGGGVHKDWTWGCIAVSDEDIEIIWEYTKMNTPVEIYK